jgi:hypothetical protein
MCNNSFIGGDYYGPASKGLLQQEFEFFDLSVCPCTVGRGDPIVARFLPGKSRLWHDLGFGFA